MARRKNGWSACLLRSTMVAEGHNSLTGRDPTRKMAVEGGARRRGLLA